MLMYCDRATRTVVLGAATEAPTYIDFVNNIFLHLEAEVRIKPFSLPIRWQHTDYYRLRIVDYCLF